MITFIKNGTIVNEGRKFRGSLLIDGETIKKIVPDSATPDEYDGEIAGIEGRLSGMAAGTVNTIDATGLTVLPGIIDDQVHFREPGNTEKADIESESKAAVLGGVTSFMDMPNNNPPATTLQLLEKKYCTASEKSYCNYSFYLGATNENIGEIRSMKSSDICGVKVFMGSSTGNMLVNDKSALEAIFREAGTTIATHCEEEEIIRENLRIFRQKYGESIPFEAHPLIRSREACIESTRKALDLALKYNSKLHILHISTADEVEMIKQARKINPKISGEICVHYLIFNSSDFKTYGALIKCNPSIKEESDMIALRNALKERIISVVATDHAPHLEIEKKNVYTKAPSGLPLVQHSLQLMLELVKKGIFTLEDIAEFMSHSPARCFGIKNRGFIREGYYADLAILDLNSEYAVNKGNIAYKCGWSPFEGHKFSSRIVHTFVNGTHTVENGHLTGKRNCKRLFFGK